MDVINIRGPNGAGKTWVVNQNINRFGGENIELGPGRRVTHLLESPKQAAAVGHYVRLATGGADRIRRFDEVIATLEEMEEAGYEIAILEGALLSTVGKTTYRIATRWPTSVVHLNTSLEDCLRNVSSRRCLSGKDGEISEKTRENIAAKWKRNRELYEKFCEEGDLFLSVGEMSTEEAVNSIIKLLEERK